MAAVQADFSENDHTNVQSKPIQVVKKSIVSYGYSIVSCITLYYIYNTANIKFLQISEGKRTRESETSEVVEACIILWYQRKFMLIANFTKENNSAQIYEILWKDQMTNLHHNWSSNLRTNSKLEKWHLKLTCKVTEIICAKQKADHKKSKSKLTI